VNEPERIAIQDTIVAVATPPGRGGIGVVRVSGENAQQLAELILGRSVRDRYAEYGDFLDSEQQAIERGILIFYRGPASYTGEDVFELQAHGSPLLLDALVERLVVAGARTARPGEFTERAFLNGKLDLAQAEAVADLINARTLSAARAANRSLAGDFSRAVTDIVEAVTQLRIRVEAAIDFPEEELDLPAISRLKRELLSIEQRLVQLISAAAQTVVLTEGLRVVLAGPPNVGKSSLMNRLIGDERVIVSDTPGTTRDVISVQAAFDGVPITLIDTAGLRDTKDQVESAGVQLAKREIGAADHLLVISDDSVAKDENENEEESPFDFDTAAAITRVWNKIDITGRVAGLQDEQHNEVAVSALTGAGITELKQSVIQAAGQESLTDAPYVARRRHLASLEQAIGYLRGGMQHLNSEETLELCAEELRQASLSLGEITGIVSSDELLGRIFADFCIGK